MESTRDSLMAIGLLLVVLVAVVGTLLINPVMTVWVVVLATAINGLMLVMLTIEPKL